MTAAAVTLGTGVFGVDFSALVVDATAATFGVAPPSASLSISLSVR